MSLFRGMESEALSSFACLENCVTRQNFEVLATIISIHAINRAGKTDVIDSVVCICCVSFHKFQFINCLYNFEGPHFL